MRRPLSRLLAWPLLLALALLGTTAPAPGPLLAGPPASPLPVASAALGPLAAAAGAAATLAWRTEAVDAPPYFNVRGCRSMAVNSAGNPRIAYGGDHLYYASFDGGSWYTHTVDDSPGVGVFASIALDSGGLAHISYQDGANDDLKYAHFHCTGYICGWLTETVDSMGSTGSYTSIAMDGSNYPHISYYYWPDGALRYAYQDAAGWHLETVDSGLGNAGGYTSLALDGSGRPHISYYDDTSANLKYAWHDGTSWHIEAVDTAGSVGRDGCLALDGNGRPHISYYDLSNTALKYAAYDGTSWQIETPDNTSSLGSHTSLALDGLGQPHISYRSNDGEYLRYIWYSDEYGLWFWGIPDSTTGSGYYTSLALDGSDLPLISHLDLVNGDLRFARYDGTDWSLEVLDGGATFLGWGTSVVANAGGYRAITYVDGSNDLLKRATRVGGDDDWWLWEMDEAGPWGTSQALDSTGVTHIAYQNKSQSDLRYMHFVGMGGDCGPYNSWRCHTADSSPQQTGWYPSLDMDGNDLPHIAHYDYTDGDLEYTYWDGTMWHPVTVDSAGDVGKRPSLQVSGTEVYVSYWDSTNECLKYAHRAWGVWTPETVECGTYVGQYSSLALDSLGRPHIAYGGPNGASLRHAWYDGGWQIETIDTVPYVSHLALAIDTHDHPAIAYYVSPPGHLQVARYVGIGGNCGPQEKWRCDLVEEGLYVGTEVAIALDELGRPCISYQDNANGDLRYAEWYYAAVLPLVEKR